MSLGGIQEGEHLEALFDQDQKWYRVQVTRIDSTERCVHVYFGDYGNMARIDEADMKQKPMLRRRRWELSKDSELFGLEYQAIRCYYCVPACGGKMPLEEFLEKVAAIDSESGKFTFFFNIQQ